MENHNKPSTALFDVYLRLRPSTADRDRFLDVEQVEHGYAPTHITIRPPAGDNRKRAVEKFAFTRVYEEDAGQRELFESTGTVQLIQGVLGESRREGRDGLVATLGVTGSGKVYSRNMIDLDAFLPDRKWTSHAPLPIFKGAIRFYEIVEQFCTMLDTLPHDQSFSQLIVTQMRNYYDRSYGWSKSLLQRVQMSAAEGDGAPQ